MSDGRPLIPEPLVSILEAARTGSKVRPSPHARLFLDGNGRPWNRKTRNAALREALAHVPEEEIAPHRIDGDADYLAFDWHSLRPTVRTVLSLRGHRDAAVGQLLGQANPATLTGTTTRRRPSGLRLLTTSARCSGA